MKRKGNEGRGEGKERKGKRWDKKGKENKRKESIEGWEMKRN